MKEWLRRLLGGKKAERPEPDPAFPDPNIAALAADEYGVPDDEDDEDEITCGICEQAILRDGYCSHTICAYRPLGAPLGPPPLPGTNPLVHFLHNTLPAGEIERLCAAVSTYASRNPKSKAWEDLDPLIEHMVAALWKRETNDGDGAFIVTCDTFDDYLYNRLHDSVEETFMGAASEEVFLGERLASIAFRAYFATDVPRIADHLRTVMQRDSESLEQHLRA